MIISFIICISGCQQKKQVMDDERKIYTESKDTITNNDLSLEENHYRTSESYSIGLSVIENKDMSRPEGNKEWIKTLKINYPQIYNMEDYDKEVRLNNLLINAAMNKMDFINERDYIDYTINYKIMEVNENILSILFIGESHYPGRAYNMAYTITIDLTTEKVMDLSEFYIVNNEFFLDHYDHGRFRLVENNFENIDDNKLFIEEYMKDYNNKTHAHDFYIIGDNIGIIIPVPQAMGYIILESMTK